MFGKKNDVLRVMHYEGISQFAADYPCTLEKKDGQFIITRIKPQTVVTLPLDRVLSVSAMTEPQFMEKYYGYAASTNKAHAIKKYYLVITYDKGYLAFWGTVKEYSKFIDMQYEGQPAPDRINL